MATATKKTTKKNTAKKAAVKKNKGLTTDEKKIVWLALTIMVALAAYFVLTFFA